MDNSPATDTVGARIKTERSRLGISQARLAAALDISPVTVWRWENDRNVPSLELLGRIADLFGMPISALNPADDSFFD